ncbi:hypothetical protein C2G38_2202236 [Gigaspora rosea]|uniref:Uncharacterized protein n=1 Tax=Gigaspora rosea TaxID=44941 RepID=A0A397USV8_9GLOM|nr:hypothetical protein C2G38_2202236 [Gigaspora rosea]
MQSHSKKNTGETRRTMFYNNARENPTKTLEKEKHARQTHKISTRPPATQDNSRNLTPTQTMTKTRPNNSKTQRKCKAIPKKTPKKIPQKRWKKNARPIHKIFCKTTPQDHQRHKISSQNLTATPTTTKTPPNNDTNDDKDTSRQRHQRPQWHQRRKATS